MSLYPSEMTGAEFIHEFLLENPSIPFSKNEDFIASVWRSHSSFRKAKKIKPIQYITFAKYFYMFRKLNLLKKTRTEPSKNEPAIDRQYHKINNGVPPFIRKAQLNWSRPQKPSIGELMANVWRFPYNYLYTYSKEDRREIDVERAYYKTFGKGRRMETPEEIFKLIRRG